ncbi:BRO-N domain-containing protein [Pararhodobacter sp.]|uniref:BRO-N domain-containing protein n=1 Tax=Pararhodobacter sp. TaxID=2127056 RepID=UPI002FDC95A0
MSAEIIPFDFEDQAVRVLMRDGEPWFVVNDVCRVLEIGNPRDAVSRLDDDEKDVGSADTLGGNQKVTIISESGLYALVLTSRKEAARRFRKWITAEVLPAIRRHGRYEHVAVTPAEPVPGGEIAGLPIREAELWLSLVREARMTRGARAALTLWQRSPLPQLDGPAQASKEDGRNALSRILNQIDGGRSVAELIEAARAGEFAAAQALAALGLRIVAAGLFIANHASGALRAALLVLPGVTPAEGVRTLAGRPARGIVIPFALLEA